MTETTKGAQGILPVGATGAVAGFGAGTFNDTGFQVSFGGGLAGADQPPIGIALTGATGFVGETDRGGPAANKGYTVTPTGNNAPDVTVPGAGDDPAADAVRADRQRHRSQR